MWMLILLEDGQTAITQIQKRFYLEQASLFLMLAALYIGAANYKRKLLLALPSQSTWHYQWQ